MLYLLSSNYSADECQQVGVSPLMAVLLFFRNNYMPNLSSEASVAGSAFWF